MVVLELRGEKLGCSDYSRLVERAHEQPGRFLAWYIPSSASRNSASGRSSSQALLSKIDTAPMT